MFCFDFHSVVFKGFFFYNFYNNCHGFSVSIYIASPLLFIIYINDIGLLGLRGKFQLYADDAVLLCTDLNPRNLALNLSNDLCLLNDWFLFNKLSLNYKKTNYVLFSKPYSSDKNVRY